MLVMGTGCELYLQIMLMIGIWHTQNLPEELHCSHIDFVLCSSTLAVPFGLRLEEK